PRSADSERLVVSVPTTIVEFMPVPFCASVASLPGYTLRGGESVVGLEHAPDDMPIVRAAPNQVTGSALLDLRPHGIQHWPEVWPLAAIAAKSRLC
ncbi:MAG: hypothetical protein J2P16_11615, partial [Mycobacterium sp.]|nr:hypothetical protein [Mycobacterium sp.]